MTTTEEAGRRYLVRPGWRLMKELLQMAETSEQYKDGVEWAVNAVMTARGILSSKAETERKEKQGLINILLSHSLVSVRTKDTVRKYPGAFTIRDLKRLFRRAERSRMRNYVKY